MKLKNTIINFHVIKNMEWMENILFLLKRHFTLVGIDELEDFYFNGLDLKNACHITVDDGDESVYTHLLPLIKKHKIPISIYVSPYIIETGQNFWFQEIKDLDLQKFLNFYGKKIGHDIKFIDKNQVFGIIKSLKVDEINALIKEFKLINKIVDKDRIGMNIDQLLEIKETGLIEIGAHTNKHPILMNEDDATARFEIQNSIENLSKMINQKVRCFAYPNGIPGVDFSEREVNFLKESGIKLAFSTENKRFSKSDNPLYIPRTGISKGSRGFILTKLIFGSGWDNLKGLFKGNREMDFRKVDYYKKP